jgi:hypothetical protein
MIALDEYAAGGASAEGLETVGAASRKKIQEARPGNMRAQARKYGLAQTIGRRPNDFPFRDDQGNAPGNSTGNSHR